MGNLKVTLNPKEKKDKKIKKKQNKKEDNLEKIQEWKFELEIF